MTALYIDRRGAEIDLEGDTIVVRVDGERSGTAPLRALSRVVVQGSAQIGTRLVSRLAERGVGLAILPARAKQPPSILVPAAGDGALRLAQLQLLMDEPRRAALSCDLVRAKTVGQTRFLRSIDKTRPSHILKDAIAKIDRATNRLASDRPGPDRAALRGVEGAASAAYFKGLVSVFPTSLAFTGRNRRPPRDPVNVVLSLGYTLLHNIAIPSAVGAGLDPSIGVYHDIAPGRDSLASDLVEPVRPVIDSFAHRLFTDGVLRAEDFTTRGDACRMGKSGRADFYRSFEEETAGVQRLMRRAAETLAADLRAMKTGPPALTQRR